VWRCLHNSEMMQLLEFYSEVQQYCHLWDVPERASPTRPRTRLRFPKGRSFSSSDGHGMSSHKQVHHLLRTTVHTSTLFQSDSCIFETYAGVLGVFRVRRIGPSRRVADAFGVAGPGLCYGHFLAVLAELFLV